MTKYTEYNINEEVTFLNYDLTISKGTVVGIHIDSIFNGQEQPTECTTTGNPSVCVMYDIIPKDSEFPVYGIPEHSMFRDKLTLAQELFPEFTIIDQNNPL